MNIPKERLEKILAHRDSCGHGPLLHLNETEALSFSGKKYIDEASRFFSEKTNGPIVITLGERGCFCREGESGCLVSGFPVKAVNTTGAGDAHCGAVIAGLKQGKPLKEACEIANKTAAAVVEGKEPYR
jgi:sugar/nucleoside kinase (ribokinase family)